MSLKIVAIVLMQKYCIALAVIKLKRKAIKRAIYNYTDNQIKNAEARCISVYRACFV